jgi:hypothetical protein
MKLPLLINEDEPPSVRELLMAWVLLAVIVGVSFYFAC